MFIGTVDTGLERLLRHSLPLPEEVGDITFEAPTSNWSAQLSRVTVNLFLYDVARSGHPVRSITSRTGPDGVAQRRAPQPMVQLSYLVSAWAGSIKDEHQLLGDVVGVLACAEIIPPDLLPDELSSSAALGFGEDAGNKTREIWTALGGTFKASFTLQVHVAADAFEWTEQAAAVERIEALAKPVPDPAAHR